MTRAKMIDYIQKHLTHIQPGTFDFWTDSDVETMYNCVRQFDELAVSLILMITNKAVR